MSDPSPFEDIEVEDMAAFVEDDEKELEMGADAYRFVTQEQMGPVGRLPVTPSSSSYPDAYMSDLGIASSAHGAERPMATSMQNQEIERAPVEKRSPPAAKISRSTSNTSRGGEDSGSSSWGRRSSRQRNANPKYAESGDMTFLENEEKGMDVDEVEEEDDDETDNTEDDDVATKKTSSSSRRGSASKRSKATSSRTAVMTIERKIETLLGRRTSKEGGHQEYLIKWAGRAYIHVTWETEEYILSFANGTHHLTRFQKKALSGKVYIDINDDYFNPEYTMVDRIIGVRRALVLEEGVEELTVQYLVKWRSLQYNDATWESEKVLCDIGYLSDIERFYKTAAYPKRSSTIEAKGRQALARARRPRAFKESKESPKDFASGHELRSYQLEGMNWLCFNWHNGRNSILADEMGLGKTVQSVALFHYLFTKMHIPGPFLVVAPLSTIAHWQREIEGWTQMHPVVYHGSGASRDIIRQYEWDKFLPEACGSSKPADSKVIPKDHSDMVRYPGSYRFHILITTYEMVLKDTEKLSKISWACMVVDEAHRLKNKSSSLFRSLTGFRLHHCVLLTGTPIQNKIAELGTLLHFLEPQRFTDIDAFEAQFGDLKKKAQVDALHKMLRPYLLRRMKGDVEKALPPREETLVEVQLTRSQKQYYKAIYEKNTEYLVSKTGSKPSLINIGMQLRKCCNHPFLLDGAEDAILSEDLPGVAQPSVGEDGKPNTDEKYHADMKKMILSCGKLVLVDKLLPKLKSQGHRVLIFSQMVRVLDILEDYLHYRSYSYERLDGTMKSSDRQAGIDRFSKEGSDIFVFLLCTRAGGVGINLTAADTVIIYDSDWNPQNDIQAQARCHRIGQTKNVKVYRLVTANTYESEMFQRASMKLGLDKAVLHSMAEVAGGTGASKKPMKKSEVEALLKHGAYHVFLNTDESKADEFCEQDIDTILARNSQVVTMNAGGASSAGSNSTFSKATFVADETKVDINDPEFWAKLGLKKRKAESEYLGARRRTLTRRYGMTKDEDDFNVDSDPGNDDDLYYNPRQSSTSGAQVAGEDLGPEDEKYFEKWSKVERETFVACLKLFGPFRWHKYRSFRPSDPYRDIGDNEAEDMDREENDDDDDDADGAPLRGRSDEALTRYFGGVMLLLLRLVQNSPIPSVQHTILSQVIFEARRLLPPDALSVSQPVPQTPTALKALNAAKASAPGTANAETAGNGPPSASPTSQQPDTPKEFKKPPAPSPSPENDESDGTVSPTRTASASGEITETPRGSPESSPQAAKEPVPLLKLRGGSDKSLLEKQTPASDQKKPKGVRGKSGTTHIQRECERCLELLGGCDPSLDSPPFVARENRVARATLQTIERLWILHQIMLTPLFVPEAAAAVAASSSRKRNLKKVKSEESTQKETSESGEKDDEKADGEKADGEKADGEKAGAEKSGDSKPSSVKSEKKPGDATENDEDQETTKKKRPYSRWCRPGHWKEFRFPNGFKLKEAKAGPPAEWWGEEEDQELIKGVYLLGYRKHDFGTMREHPLLLFRRHQAEQAKKVTKGRQRSYDADGNKLWPSDSTLNKRFTMLISALAKELRKAQKEDKHKRKKKVKQVKSAWMFFSKQVWNSVKKENPNASFSEIGKKVGEKWKLLTPDEKIPYAHLHMEDLQRYRAARRAADQEEDEDADAWDSSNNSDATVEDKGKSQPSTQKRKKKKIKAAKSAWMFFNKEKWQDMKDSCPESSFTDICKMLAKRWRELSKEEKAPYVDMQHKDVERFNQETSQRVKEEGISKRARNRPKVKVAKSAWMFFNRDTWAKTKAENPGANFSEIGRIVGRQWKALSEEEKIPYQKQYEEDLIRYRSELKAAQEELDRAPSEKADASKESSSAKKRSRPRPVKSAWVYFSKQEWAKVKAENPEMDFKAVGKVVSERWKALSVEDKKPFLESQKADAARYHREKAEKAARAELNMDDDDDDADLPDKSKDTGKKIKQVKSAWIYFSKATWSKVKAENPNASFPEIGKRVGELWKSLSNEDKAPYIEKQKADAVRYRQEKKTRAEDISRDRSPSPADLSSGDPGIQRRKVTPARPSYMFFAKQHWDKVKKEVEESLKPEKEKENDGDKVKDDSSGTESDKDETKDEKKQPAVSFAKISRRMGVLWKSMSEEEKESYNAKAAEDRQRYARERKVSDEEYDKALSELKAKETKHDSVATVKPELGMTSDTAAAPMKVEGDTEDVSAVKDDEEATSTDDDEKPASSPSQEEKPKSGKKRNRISTGGEGVAKKPRLGLKKANVKKAKSAWMFFSMAMWDTVRGDMPDAVFGDIGKYLGETWKTLSPLEKAPYLELHQQDKKRFDVEISNCIDAREDSSSKAGEGNDNLASVKKPPSKKIKSAKTAYGYYSGEVRSKIKTENPEESPAQITKRVCDLWRSLPPEGKEKYQSRHAADVDRYNEELKMVKRGQNHAGQETAAIGADAAPPLERSETPQSHGEAALQPGQAAEGSSVAKTPKPKGGKTAWQCYSKANWAKVKADNPELKFGDLGKIMGMKWKALTSEEKKPYEELANISQSMAAQGGGKQSAKKRKTPPNEKEGGANKVKRDKDGKPKVKNALSAWMFFSKAKWGEVKADNPDVDFATIGRIVGNKWKALSSEEKQPYLELHEQDVKRYHREREALGLWTPSTDSSSSVRRGGKKNDRIKPATTAFVFYSRELRPRIKAENPDMAPDQVRRMLSEGWRNIEPESKQRYLDMHRQDVERAMLQRRERSEKEAAEAAALAEANAQDEHQMMLTEHQAQNSPSHSDLHHPPPSPPPHIHNPHLASSQGYPEGTEGGGVIERGGGYGGMQGDASPMSPQAGDGVNPLPMQTMKSFNASGTCPRGMPSRMNNSRITAWHSQLKDTEPPQQQQQQPPPQRGGYFAAPRMQHAPNYIRGEQSSTGHGQMMGLPAAQQGGYQMETQGEMIPSHTGFRDARSIGDPRGMHSQAQTMHEQEQPVYSSTHTSAMPAKVLRSGADVPSRPVPAISVERGGFRQSPPTIRQSPIVQPRTIRQSPMVQPRTIRQPAMQTPMQRPYIPSWDANNASTPTGRGYYPPKEPVGGAFQSDGGYPHSERGGMVRQDGAGVIRQDGGGVIRQDGGSMMLHNGGEARMGQRGGNAPMDVMYTSPFRTQVNWGSSSHNSRAGGDGYEMMGMGMGMGIPQGGEQNSGNFRGGAGNTGGGAPGGSGVRDNSSSWE